MSLHEENAARSGAESESPRRSYARSPSSRGQRAARPSSKRVLEEPDVDRLIVRIIPKRVVGFSA